MDAEASGWSPLPLGPRELPWAPLEEGTKQGAPPQRDAGPLIPFVRCEVSAEDGDLSLGELVRRRLKPSVTLYRRLKARGGLLLNGQSVPAFTRVAPGDRVELALPGEAAAAPEPMELVIPYEDGQVLVVDKPAGLVMHPARGHDAGTLVNGLAFYRLSRGEPPWVHPVHRLDRLTSGLVLVAKDPYTHERLVRRRRVGRSYVALVLGRLQPVSGVVDAPILDPPDGPATAANAGAGLPAGMRSVSSAGRPACTRYRVAAWGQLGGAAATLVVVRLRTGRTHQIRLHMALLGHPVAGDPLYGAQAGHASGQRLMLHARKLWFDHPVTGAHVVLRSRPEFLGRI